MPGWRGLVKASSVILRGEPALFSPHPLTTLHVKASGGSRWPIAAGARILAGASHLPVRGPVWPGRSLEPTGLCGLCVLLGSLPFGVAARA